MSQSKQEIVLFNVTLYNLTPPILSVIANYCLVMRVCETLLLSGQRVRNGGGGGVIGFRRWLPIILASNACFDCLKTNLQLVLSSWDQT